MPLRPTLILLIGTLSAVAPRASQASEVMVPYHARIDPVTYTELQDSPDGTAYVIVVLTPVELLDRSELGKYRASIRTTQERVLAGMSRDDFALVYRYENVPALTGRVGIDGLAKLASMPEVVRVGPDARGHAHLAQSVPFINADDVHNLGYTGQGMTVAVLDSGIDTNHPDLSDNIAPGAWHFLDQGATQGPGAEDDNGHGTNVCGVITSRGLMAPPGVAPDTDILAVKVLRADGSGWLSDFTAGVDYVVGVHGNYAGLCAINMSLGSWELYGNCPCDNDTPYNLLLQTAIQAAWNVGIPTFASSGNQGSCTTMSSPACLSAAVAVAAVYDENLGREPNSGTYQDEFGSLFADCYDAATSPDKISCFSNRSACNELAGPGRTITAPGMGGAWSTYTGTSRAAPHCAGVVALMCELISENCDSPSPAQIVQILKATGQPTDDPCGTSPNPVRVDALAAFSAVTFPDCNGNGLPDGCDIANGTSTDCNNNGVPDECEGDVCPPTPNPMTWDVPPAPISTSELTMSATVGIDDSPPVEYYFFWLGNGSGGNTSGWLGSRTYNDDGLVANTVYSYMVRARDSASPPNYGTYSQPLVSGVTYIEAPTGITFGTVTDTSIEVTADGSFTNLTLGQSGIFFEMAPAAGSGANAWVQTPTTNVTGLTPGTAYTFRVKSRNAYGVEPPSPWVGPFTQSTSGGVSCVLAGDLNGDGVLTGVDIPGYVRAKLGQPAEPGENPACAEFGTGTLAGDNTAFVTALLGT